MVWRVQVSREWRFDGDSRGDGVEEADGARYQRVVKGLYLCIQKYGWRLGKQGILYIKVTGGGENKKKEQ